MSTRLRKIERVVFTPATPGTPAFGGATVCAPPAPTGLLYRDCRALGYERGLPTDTATQLAFGLRPYFYNGYWLPGCVYAERVAGVGSCSSFTAPIRTARQQSSTGIVCQSAAGARYRRVLDEFGRSEAVTPAPVLRPPAETFVPFSPPPATQPVTIPPGATDLGGGCYAFPPRPEVPGTPASTRVQADQAWDSGAHSEVAHPADCRLTFTASDAIGAACGLTPAGTQPRSDVERITHGFILSRNNGVPSARVIESGEVVTGFIPVAIGETLQVTRIGTQVIYNVASAGQVYASTRPSSGPVKAAASLFAPGDSIG